jgi:hypothetical protein
VKQNDIGQEIKDTDPDAEPDPHQIITDRLHEAQKNNDLDQEYRCKAARLPALIILGWVE